MRQLAFSSDILELLKKERTVSELSSVVDKVNTIISDVVSAGDEALVKYTKLFDTAVERPIAVQADEVGEAINLVSQEIKDAIAVAEKNITRFHQASIHQDIAELETTRGIFCSKKAHAIERVGLYIPGGTAPLISSLLMLAIPAKLAGCKEIVITTPSQKNGKVSPALLYCANRLNLSEIYAIGGAQAIAALAYGTKTIKNVDKIAGPGNIFVTTAKQIVASTKVAIDMPAGPSEVALVIDSKSNLDFVVADILSQAEHDTLSKVLVVMLPGVNVEKLHLTLASQLATLPRADIAKKALESGYFITVNTYQEAIETINIWSPEHLIINIENPNVVLDGIVNAGSVFVGQYTPESLGDYASGTNHVLPTSGWARSWSGVSVETFRKWTTYQRATLDGVTNLSNTVATLARAEGLEAHARAVEIRVKK
jgi:histidinol dehydrogenase